MRMENTKQRCPVTVSRSKHGVTDTRTAPGSEREAKSDATGEATAQTVPYSFAVSAGSGEPIERGAWNFKICALKNSARNIDKTI